MLGLCFSYEKWQLAKCLHSSGDAYICLYYSPIIATVFSIVSLEVFLGASMLGMWHDSRDL